MPRTPPSGHDESGVKVVYLAEVVFWDGSSEVVVRVASAKQDVVIDADGDGSDETYDGVGDFLSWGPHVENTDRRGQGVALELSGVDPSIIATLLQNDFRGRRVRIWRVRGDPDTGTWTESWLVHRGLQLEDYRISEQVPDDDDEPITAKIRTRSVARTVGLQGTNAVKANQRSHHAMLERKGVANPSDTGLLYVPQLPGRVFWGSEAPDPALTGGGSGGSAGTRGGGGGGEGSRPGDTRFQP